MKNFWNETSNGLSTKERIFWMLFFVVSFPLAFLGGMELWEIIHNCMFAIENFN